MGLVQPWEGEEMEFKDWFLDSAEWCLVLPIAILDWFWHWRYAVLWISSLSLEYFSLIAIAYYWNIYPENAVTSLLSILFLLLIIWGYYKHRTTQHPSPTLV